MIKMRIEGAAELSRALAGMSKRVGRSVLRTALLAGATPIAREASLNAPRGSGAKHLAENIRISNARDEGNAVAIAVGPTKGVFYGFFQEFGTSRQAAQAFMRPAFDTEQRRATQVIGGALWRAIIAGGFASGRGSGGGLGEGALSTESPSTFEGGMISGGPGGGTL